jgi:hypothetical protein
MMNSDSARPPAPVFNAGALTNAADVHQQMCDLIYGFQASQAVRAIADLSLADHLSSDGLTATDIAEREGAPVDTTFRLMRAGVALGLMTAEPTGVFHGTELLATLRKDAPRSLRPLALMQTSQANWLAWTELVSSLRSGRSEVRKVLQSEFFTHLERNAQEGADFSAAMSSGTMLWAADIADLIDTANVQRAVDVGGANGTLLRLLQQANPTLRGVVFDRPSVIERTRAEITRNGCPERTDVLGGDFFTSVPDGDLYLLKFILHDWSDQDCIQILRQCRRALRPHGRVAIIEFLVGDLADPGTRATLTDLAMHLLFTGRERSLDEFDVLLAAADLRRTTVRPAVYPQAVIEAVAV